MNKTISALFTALALTTSPALSQGALCDTQYAVYVTTDSVDFQMITFEGKNPSYTTLSSADLSLHRLGDKQIKQYITPIQDTLKSLQDDPFVSVEIIDVNTLGGHYFTGVSGENMGRLMPIRDFKTMARQGIMQPLKDDARSVTTKDITRAIEFRKTEETLDILKRQIDRLGIQFIQSKKPEPFYFAAR